MAGDKKPKRDEKQESNGNTKNSAKSSAKSSIKSSIKNSVKYSAEKSVKSNVNNCFNNSISNKVNNSINNRVNNNTNNNANSNANSNVNSTISNNSINKYFKYAVLPFIILLSASGFFLILYAEARYGPASTHDSVAYMYASESLVNGKGLVYFGYDSPFVQWPPLYPFVLSLFNLLGFNLINAAGCLNGLIFSLIVFFSGYWLLEGTRSPITSICGSITVLASIPLTYVSKFVWSEPLFVLLLLLFMINLDNYVRGLSLKSLAGCIIFAALAVLTRYIGVTLIMTGCIILLVHKNKFINRIVEAFVFGFFSSLPIALWMLRNYLLVKTLTGGRSPAQNTFADNISLTFKKLASWFAPDYAESAFYLMLSLVVLILVFIRVRNRLISKSLVAGVETKEISIGKSSGLTHRIAIPFILTFIYISYLVVSASIVAFDSINDRLLAPAFVPITMGSFFLLHGLVKFKNGKIQAILGKSTLIILYLAWLIYPASEIAAATRYSHDKGAGILASEWWANSKLIEYVSKMPAGIKIYSNFPDAIYIHTGKIAGYTPKKEGLSLYRLDRFKEIIENEVNAYIAWFDSDTSSTVYNIDELKDYIAMDEIEKLPGGAIFKITGLRSFYDEKKPD